MANFPGIMNRNAEFNQLGVKTQSQICIGFDQQIGSLTDQPQMVQQAFFGTQLSQ